MSEPVRRSLLSRFFNAIWSVVVWSYRLIVIAVLLAVILGFWFSKKSSGLTIEDNVALVIAPSGELVDQVDVETMQLFAERFNGDPPSQTALRDIVEALDTAAKDKRIPMAVLKLDYLRGAGMAQIEELGAALERFKARGKPVHVHGPYYDQAAYLIASHADEISLDPLGGVGIEGLSSYQPYFKDALDKLGVTVNVFRVGEYKSAVEPFLRNDMSPEAKAANLDWMGDLWTRYGAEIAKRRELPEGAINQYVEGMADGIPALKGDLAQYALQNKLVTHVETIQQFRERMAKVVRWDDESGSFRQIYFGDYLNATRFAALPPTDTEAQVALVVVQGEIIDGVGAEGMAGGDTIAELLDEARRSDEVQAVVLRVNSPGGSVFASEQIRRGVQALRAAGKPVVSSMSSVAASGGYWISMSADRIVAHESTITGSIGIFGLIPTIEGPLKKIGVSTDGVGTTSMAGSFDLTRPMPEPAKRIVQSVIEKGYQDFITGVAEGRKLEVAAVDELARGRVWSGLKAKQLGLVDEFGGLKEATQLAAKLAKLDEGKYRLQDFAPQPESPLEAFTQMFGQGLLRLQSPTSIDGWLQELKNTRTLKSLTGWMNDPNGAYVRCFCNLTLGQ